MTSVLGRHGPWSLTPRASQWGQRAELPLPSASCTQSFSPTPPLIFSTAQQGGRDFPSHREEPEATEVKPPTQQSGKESQGLYAGLRFQGLRSPSGGHDGWAVPEDDLPQRHSVTGKEINSDW